MLTNCTVYDLIIRMNDEPRLTIQDGIDSLGVTYTRQKAIKKEYDKLSTQQIKDMLEELQGT